MGWLSPLRQEAGRSRAADHDGRLRLQQALSLDRGVRAEEPAKQFVIDGEAIVRGVDGYSDFNALHSGRHGDSVELVAFDVLAMDGDDLRDLPLSMRKTNLQRLLRGRPDGIFFSDFEQGEIGPDLFRKACEFKLEGIVSKLISSPYRPGPSQDWRCAETELNRQRFNRAVYSAPART